MSVACDHGEKNMVYLFLILSIFEERRARSWKYQMD